MTEQTGYIALSRAYLHHPVVGIHDPEAFAVWCWLMAEAAWGDRRVPVAGRSVVLAPGQLSHSVRFIAAKFGWAKSRMDRFLRRLEVEGLITKTGTAGGTAGGTAQRLITICDETMFPAGPADDGTAGGTASGTDLGQIWDKERTINQSSSPPPPPSAGADEILDGDGPTDPVVQPAFRLEEPPGPDPVDRMVEAWNETARAAALPLVRTVTDRRRAAAARWLRDCGTLSVWATLLERIRGSPVLNGTGGRMRADFDFALDPHQTTRILEGCYDSLDEPTSPGPRLAAADGARVGRPRRSGNDAGRVHARALAARLMGGGDDADADGAGELAGERSPAGGGFG